MTEAVAPVTHSLYIHVPFCRSRCTYCDFHSAVIPDYGSCAQATRLDPGRLRVQSWSKAIERHLAALKLAPGWEPYTTMYVGGGTPTVLPTSELEHLLAVLAVSWAGSVSGAAISSAEVLVEALPDKVPGCGTEWSIECNPDDLTRPMLDSFDVFGVSRLSVGVQSLEDPVRQVVRRRGSAAEILSALGNLARHWKRNWSADFMYGMPGQTPAGLAQDIKHTIDLGAGHISLYQLTLEEGTALATEVHRGSILLPDLDLSADQYNAAAEELVSAGYLRYEVSNWALPGQECQHNLHYWRMDDWDAIGPSGVSNRREGAVYVRGQNPADDNAYEADPLGSVSFSAVRHIDAMFEYLMMALRTSEGFSVQRFHDIFGRDPSLVFGNLPEEFPTCIRGDSGRWYPANEGMDMLNRVLVAALEAADHAKDSETGGLPL
ncbi:MAG: coproporphyrinogen-III oxidase family protein [Spirochaetota bacterium]